MATVLARMCMQPRCSAASTVTDLPSTRASPAPAGRDRAAAQLKEVTLLDYGAGNVRSIRNACRKLGYSLREVNSVADIASADRIIFPGVGACGQAMQALQTLGYRDALRDYILEGRPFLGICLGLQLLFEGSEENGGTEGLGIIPGRVTRFEPTAELPVPQIGWNQLTARRESDLLAGVGSRRVYYVNSYRATPSEQNADWVLATSDYGGEFVGVVHRGDVYATQFHPEKSGAAGLRVLRNFLEPGGEGRGDDTGAETGSVSGLAKRVVVALDVRTNDAGDLVVTKGDQYDVREGSTAAGGEVRNLGKPVSLAGRYFEEGADEICFLNITGFRDFPLGDLPMLQVLASASENVFVPLTVGGGIRDFTDADGRHYGALEVAAAYFRSGADKVSIGGDAVDAAEEYFRAGAPTGRSSIEQISWHYGAQAVVVSIDPRRVWVADPADCPHATVRSSRTGPQGEQYCWWQCTVRGGREARGVGAVELARAAEALGAGELMLNCIDQDGTNQGFDIELVRAVSDAVSIPVIASSGAGCAAHFTEVFQQTKAAAALAAGIFHRKEVQILDVKREMDRQGIAARLA